jgi:TAG lipase/steryl ester hydrolase/phospholipase A2/LPA acyltransferase
LVFSAASLLAKDPKTGKEVPWNQTPDASWIDGSVDNDLPMTRLAEMFNVNHFIVSQVNPHVVPFLDKEEGILARDVQDCTSSLASLKWFNDMTALARGEALHRLQVLSEMGIFPNYVSKLRSILNQKYSGDITIFPSVSYSHFPRVLRNPTPEYMEQCLLTGERATWPKISRIRNHLAIELALDDAVRQLRARAVFHHLERSFQPPTLERPVSQGDEGLQKHRKETGRKKRNVNVPNYFPIRPVLDHQSPSARPYLPKRPPKMPMTGLDRQRGEDAVQVLSSPSNLNDSSLEEEMPEISDTSYSPARACPTRRSSDRDLFPHASLPPTPSHRASFSKHSKDYLDIHKHEYCLIQPISPKSKSKTITPSHEVSDKSVRFSSDAMHSLKHRRKHAGQLGADDNAKLEMDLSDVASS